MTPHETLTTREVAALLRCTPKKISKTATENGIGANLGGRAGYRFTQADVEALRESMRPVAESA